MNFRAILIAGLVGGGAAGTMTFLWMRFGGSEPPAILVAIVAVGLGMLAGQMVRAVNPLEHAEDDEEEPSEQVVGQTCLTCGKPIRAVADSVECDDCGAFLHEDCFDDHECAA